MNAVWKNSKADGRARLVLLAIADHQGEIGAWPSISTLAKMVNSSERSVQRDIQHLQAIGELRVEVQNAPTKTQYKSNLYWVTLPGVTESQSGVTDSAVRGDTVVVQNLNRTITEPSKAQTEKMFDEFWTSYPRKLDKAKAFRAFRSALKRAKFEDILAGVIVYRNDPKRDPDFTKYPATWLNNDAWENAATTPEARAGIEARREKELKASNEYLNQMKELEKNSAPPPADIRKRLGL
jgi:hypothetical protein